jgi:hypothetical protein
MTRRSDAGVVETSKHPVADVTIDGFQPDRGVVGKTVEVDLRIVERDVGAVESVVGHDRAQRDNSESSAVDDLIAGPLGADGDVGSVVPLRPGIGGDAGRKLVAQVLP